MQETNYTKLSELWANRTNRLLSYQLKMCQKVHGFWELVARNMGVEGETTKLLNGDEWPVLAITLADDDSTLLEYPKNKADPVSGILIGNITLTLRHDSLPNREGRVSVQLAFRFEETDFQVCRWNGRKNRPGTLDGWTEDIDQFADTIASYYEEYLKTDHFIAEDSSEDFEMPYSGTSAGFMKDPDEPSSSS